jgi:hypothetical protein
LALVSIKLAGSDAARRNVTGFIEWARGLGITAPDIFTPPDLVEV